MLTITDGTNKFQLNFKQSTDLELKLNVSAYAKTWTHIGDELYLYSQAKTGDTAELKIGTTEFKFLLRLMEKGTWEQCEGMK